MVVLLDTTAVYVAAGISDLTFSPKVRRLLEDPETVREISSVSIMEVAVKSNKGITPLTREHVEKVIEDLALTVIPFASDHAFRLFGLPVHHSDPFDRMLIATALAEDIPLLACDAEFKRYKGLQVIW
jgi:PIN domain nuclease of toxin-antitoxin system